VSTKNIQGADEATLCQEAGLRYATICMIDNYANGIQPDKQLAFSDFAEGVKRNMLVVENLAEFQESAKARSIPRSSDTCQKRQLRRGGKPLKFYPNKRTNEQ